MGHDCVAGLSKMPGRGRSPRVKPDLGGDLCRDKLGGGFVYVGHDERQATPTAAAGRGSMARDYLLNSARCGPDLLSPAA